MFEYLTRERKSITASYFIDGTGKLYIYGARVFVRVPGLPPICSAASINHSLWLTTTGEIYTYGSNENGQLGLGDKKGRNTVQRVPFELTVSQVVVSEYHSLLLTTNGEVYACGSNGSGQLGLGNYENRSTFTLVPLNLQVSQIAAGCFHSFLLTTCGEVYACGDNSTGQLGLPGRGHRTIFTPIPVNLNVSRIAVGRFHSFLLTNDGKLYVCGANSYGQLGLGVKGYRTTFTRVKVPSAFKVVQIAVGMYHSILLTAIGEVYTCGCNERGQLGLCDYNDRNIFTRAPLLTSKGISQIAAGINNSLMLTTDDRIHSTGETVKDTLLVQRFRSYQFVQKILDKRFSQFTWVPVWVGFREWISSFFGYRRRNDTRVGSL